MNVPGPAPCQCHSPAAARTVSPARMASRSPPWFCTSPAPSVTCSTCPNGCRCHAVRAPGAKCTLNTRVRDGGTGAAISSIHTCPVNHSGGPGVLSARFLRISIACADSLGVVSCGPRPLSANSPQRARRCR